MEENSYSKFKIQQLICSVRDVESQVREGYNQLMSENNPENEDVPVVLCIGPTGSGKTTFYYALNNKELEGYRENTRRRLKAKNPEENFKICHAGLAQREHIGLKYDSETKIFFCEIPNFFDNLNDNITNSFAICRVLSQMQNIKILLLVAYQDIIATKGKLLRECCQIVENIIPDKQALQPAISLVITHVNPEDLESDEDVSFLDDVEIGKQGWLLKYFKDHEKGKNKVVFYFPSPTFDELKNKTYNGFDRQPILNFIRNSQPTPITPFVLLSTESKLMILSAVDSFGCLSDILQKFALRIQIDSTESDANLDIWKERVEKFSINTYPTPKDLVDKARMIINPSTPLYDSIYESLMEIHNWRSFLELIVKDELSSNDRVLYQESQLMRPVFLNITEYFCQLLSTIHSIIIAKLEKRKITGDYNATKEAVEKEIKALKEQDEQIKQEQKMEYDMKILMEQQKTEIEKYKMQVFFENKSSYTSIFAAILKDFIEKNINKKEF